MHIKQLMTTQLNIKYLHSDAVCQLTMKATNFTRFSLCFQLCIEAQKNMEQLNPPQSLFA